MPPIDVGYRMAKIGIKRLLCSRGCTLGRELMYWESMRDQIKCLGNAKHRAAKYRSR